MNKASLLIPFLSIYMCSPVVANGVSPVTGKNVQFLEDTCAENGKCDRMGAAKGKGPSTGKLSEDTFSVSGKKRKKRKSPDYVQNLSPEDRQRFKRMIKSVGTDPNMDDGARAQNAAAIGEMFGVPVAWVIDRSVSSYSVDTAAFSRGEDLNRSNGANTGTRLEDVFQGEGDGLLNSVRPTREKGRQ